LYIKGGLWIKYYGHLNSLCAKATRAITNYTLIENTAFVSSLERILVVHTGSIQLKLDVIFCMTTEGITIIGT